MASPLLGKSLAAARVFGLLVARAGATNKALQLTYSSSAGPPALLLHKCCSSALKGTSLLLIAIARFPCVRYSYNRAAANFSPLATTNFSYFLFFLHICFVFEQAL